MRPRPGNSDALGVALVDFGSSSYVGRPAQHYVQSRYYRAPEVLLGLPFGPAADVWSLGCLAAELRLGIPALPGASEYDQLRRITRAVGSVAQPPCAAEPPPLIHARPV